MRKYKVTTVLRVPSNGRKWIVTREFNGLSHYENWVNKMDNTGYGYDESFVTHDSGAPFSEGDDYYTIEDGDVIESCWDDVSLIEFNKDPSKNQYFITKGDALEHIKIFGAKK